MICKHSQPSRRQEPHSRELFLPACLRTEIRLQSFRKAGNKLSEKGHNAREIRELKRRALLRSASTQGSPSFRRSPSYRTPSNR